jgi:hypothetical protein
MRLFDLGGRMRGGIIFPNLKTVLFPLLGTLKLSPLPDAKVLMI